MRRILSVVALLAVVGLAGQAQAGSDKKGDGFVGTWSGTWTGGSEGSFEMTISKGTDGKLGGSITPSPVSGETYTSSFRTVEVEDKTLKATFDSPDGAAEASITGTLDGATAKGTYSLKEKSQGTVVETGTWSVKKK